MRTRVGLALGAVGLALLTGASGAGGQAPQNHRAHLDGDGEVPARDTRATGQAIFRLDRTGEALHYRLVASNIENVVASHIHQGGPEVNGPVVAFLFGAAPAGGGRHDGVLATGTITGQDLVGPLAGKSLEDLMDVIRQGGAYVNVHTNDGVAPAGTGPGDFPGGEIRGQISG